MKKLTLLPFYLIFGFSYTIAQFNEHLITKESINKEIEDTRKISAEDPKKAIELCEIIYQKSKQARYKPGMLESNIIRMTRYYDMGDSERVIELSKESEKLAIEFKDIESLCAIHRLKGQAFDQMAFFDKSLREFKKSLENSEKILSDNSRYYNQALIYLGMGSLTAHTTAVVDSVMNYQEKTLEFTNKIDNSIEYLHKKYHLLAMSNINLGMTNSALGNFQVSEKYLLNALDICKNKKYSVGKRTEVLALSELAWLYYTLKNYEKVIDYANQAESLEKQISLPYIRRDIYEVLYKSYVETGNKNGASKYSKSYTSLNDSIVNAEKIAINTPVQHIIKEQSEVHKSNFQKILLIISGIILLLVVFMWFFWKHKQKKLKIYQTKLKENEYKKLTSTEKSIVIADETLGSLLLKLKRFEESQKFLRKDMSLTYLANSLNTNTRYLSEVINQNKGKNFYNYLNGLRIEYITDLLQKEPKYRSYKISYLAEICGFTSREVFSTIFKKETGVTPSYFINNLREEKSEI